MSAIKLTLSASIQGGIPSKWLRSSATTASAAASTRPLPLAAARTRGSLPVPTEPQGRTTRPCAFPVQLYPTSSTIKTLGLMLSIRRRGSNCHNCVSYFSASEPESGGEIPGPGVVASRRMGPLGNGKTERILLDDNDQKISHQPPHPSSMEDAHQKSRKLLTLPTILTIARVAAVPLLVGTFYADSWWGTTATTSIFIAAAVTDWLDGYLARKMKQGSAFGAFLDPVADKLMVAATLVLLCTRPLELDAVGQFPWLMTIPAIAIIGREITMSAVREWAASQDSKLLEAVAVNNLGKWKTATQMTALTILLATRDSSIGGSGVIASGMALLYISAGLAVWSLVVYMKKIWKVLLK